MDLAFLKEFIVLILTVFGSLIVVYVRKWWKSKRLELLEEAEINKEVSFEVKTMTQNFKSKREALLAILEIRESCLINSNRFKGCYIKDFPTEIVLAVYDSKTNQQLTYIYEFPDERRSKKRRADNESEDNVSTQPTEEEEVDDSESNSLSESSGTDEE